MCSEMTINIKSLAAKTACDQGRHNPVGRLQSMGMPTNFGRRFGTLPTPVYQRNATPGRVRDDGSGARATGSGGEACEGVRATGLSAAIVSSFRSLVHFSTALAVWRMPNETRIERIGSRLCIQSKEICYKHLMGTTSVRFDWGGSKSAGCIGR